MKTCTRCGFLKPIEEFVKSNQTKSGKGAHRVRTKSRRSMGEAA